MERPPLSDIGHHLDIDRMMAEHELILAYRDNLTESTVQKLLSMAELKLVQTGHGKRLRKRVFSILMECLQNVVNHAEQTDTGEETESLLLIGRHNNEFFIITGNRIANTAVEAFEKRIAEINAWDQKDMRGIYSARLGRSKYSEKGGAGLGLIDIYRRSGRQLCYNLRRIDGDVSFLSLHVTVDPDSDS